MANGLWDLLVTVVGILLAEWFGVGRNGDDSG